MSFTEMTTPPSGGGRPIFSGGDEAEEFSQSFANLGFMAHNDHNIMNFHQNNVPSLFTNGVNEFGDGDNGNLLGRMDSFAPTTDHQSRYIFNPQFGNNLNIGGSDLMMDLLGFNGGIMNTVNDQGGRGIQGGYGRQGGQSGQGGHGVEDGLGVQGGFGGYGVEGDHGVQSGYGDHGVEGGYGVQCDLGGYGDQGVPIGQGVQNGYTGHGVEGGYSCHGIQGVYGVENGYGVQVGQGAHGVENGYGVQVGQDAQGVENGYGVQVGQGAHGGLWDEVLAPNHLEEAEMINMDGLL